MLQYTKSQSQIRLMQSPFSIGSCGFLAMELCTSLSVKDVEGKFFYLHQVKYPHNRRIISIKALCTHMDVMTGTSTVYFFGVNPECVKNSPDQYFHIRV